MITSTIFLSGVAAFIMGLICIDLNDQIDTYKNRIEDLDNY